MSDEVKAYREAEQQRPCPLIPERLVMTPLAKPDGRWYEYAGRASYGRLLAGVLRVQTVVPPG